MLRLFAGATKEKIMHCASFLSVVIYIVGEFDTNLICRNILSETAAKKTTSLFEFAKAALRLAADRGLAVAADKRMLSTERMLTDATAKRH